MIATSQDLRKAKVSDVPEIFELIAYWAEQGRMLVRSQRHLYENLRDFYVLRDPDRLLAVGALHVLSQEIGEIRGLAVHPEVKSRGLGSRLVAACEAEALELGLPRVFAWTLEAGFFARLGYQQTDRAELPEAVSAECGVCPFQARCIEIAMVKELK